VCSQGRVLFERRSVGLCGHLGDMDSDVRESLWEIGLGQGDMERLYDMFVGGLLPGGTMSSH